MYHQPETHTLHYLLTTDDNFFGYGVFDSTGKNILYNPQSTLKTGTIDTSILGPSVYFISFYLQKGRVAKPFVVR